MSGALTIVEVLRAPVASPAVRGAIEAPAAGASVEGDTLHLVGWAVGAARAARAIEVVAGETLVARATPDLERPDVAAAFPELPGSDRPGFRIPVSTAGFVEVELQVDVILEDASRHLLGLVRVRRDEATEPAVAEADLVSVVVLAQELCPPFVATLESIVVQTYAAFDVTVVGATDQPAIIEAAGRFPGVRLAPPTSGPRAVAWNAGVAANRGGSLLFLSSGSRLAPGALAAGMRALADREDWGLVVGGHRPVSAASGDEVDPAGGLLDLLRERPVGTGATVVYRRSAVDAAGGFDERLAGEEHDDLALRIARRQPVGRHADEVLEIAEQEIPPIGGVAFGAFRRLTPFSRDYGYDRGTPVDRYYIEGFLGRHEEDVRGRVLEVSEPVYTRRFGGGRVTGNEVLSLTDDNPAATIIGDLADAPQIDDGSFDCIVLTQTLHLIYDVGAAVDTAFRTLRPGGVVLATVPGITQLERVETWHWSLTPASATRLFTDRFGIDNVTVEDHGNVLAATAFLFGLAAEELAIAELDHHDPDYPVTVAVRAVRGAA